MFRTGMTVRVRRAGYNRVGTVVDVSLNTTKVEFQREGKTRRVWIPNHNIEMLVTAREDGTKMFRIGSRVRHLCDNTTLVGTVVANTSEQALVQWDMFPPKEFYVGHTMLVLVEDAPLQVGERVTPKDRKDLVGTLLEIFNNTAKVQWDESGITQIVSTSEIKSVWSNATLRDYQQAYIKANEPDVKQNTTWHLFVTMQSFAYAIDKHGDWVQQPAALSTLHMTGSLEALETHVAQLKQHCTKVDIACHWTLYEVKKDE